MKNYIKESAIIALGFLLLGLCIKFSMDVFVNKDRVVTVKGLSEMEVNADKVTWPLMFKDIGNNLGVLYNNIENKNRAIIAFLKSKGISASEININAPEIIDTQADRYNTGTQNPYRYLVTSVITVTSTKVSLVRKLIASQSELLKQGIALTGGDYRYNITYDFTQLNNVKPKMIEDATKNARQTAEKFAKDSQSKIGKIKNARQGQIIIEDRDANTPYIKNIRVVTTVIYQLKG